MSTPENRYRLTDDQCRKFLGDMREFGYTSLTFNDVRRIADEVAEGKSALRGDVIAVILCRQIDEANEWRRVANKSPLPVAHEKDTP